jgi:threonine dehydrogenase-like Zn-dependent dehydrogenase
VLPVGDVFATGYHGVVNARAKPGDTVAVLGDGAVGISAAAAATLFGAAGIVLVGHHDDRLEVGLREPTPWWRRSRTATR